MGANSKLLHLVLRMPKSPLLVATSTPCAKFDPRSTENQNSGLEAGSTCT